MASIVRSPLFIFIFFYLPIELPAQIIAWRTDTAHVDFISEAPLEIIEATSNQLRGIIENSSRRFAFTVPMNSFQGFNSPLQKDHFNENYLESHKYTSATFSGKIIEGIDLREEGIYSLRAKGIFKVHGVARERIIKSRVEIRDGQLLLNSDFTILLREHDIDIPKIVNQKIAEEISVHVEGTFLQVID